MKKSFLILVIAGFLVIGLSEIQAQTMQAKLNQAELMNLFNGKWEGELAKDTLFYVDFKPFGTTGADMYFKVVSKGNVLSEIMELFGYNSKLNKYIGTILEKGKDAEIGACWFTSNNKYIVTYLNDISNPDKASWKCEGVFKSPDAITEIEYQNGEAVMTYNYKRVK
jgi:hypothetical protein